MKWYEQKYVNHRDWVLDNLELLNLSHTETVLVLMIDFLNQNHIPITAELLSEKSKLAKEDLDKTLDLLCARRYLDIQVKGNCVTFSLDGLFDSDTARDVQIMDRPIFELFESEFGRPLSPRELQKISDWARVYENEMIIYALRVASAYQKLSLPYIEQILNNWRKKGITTEMLEEGNYEG